MFLKETFGLKELSFVQLRSFQGVLTDSDLLNYLGKMLWGLEQKSSVLDVFSTLLLSIQIMGLSSCNERLEEQNLYSFV